MLNLIYMHQNLPFAIALFSLLIIVFFETASLLIGTSLSHAVDHFLLGHDFHLHHSTVDHGHDHPSILSWWGFGQVPTLVLIILFLFSFGTLGIISQVVSLSLYDTTQSAMLIGIPCFIVSLFLTRWQAFAIARFIPSDESSAITRESLIGRTATITLGKCEFKSSSPAKVVDEHGLTHHILLQPNDPEQCFAKGDQLTLVRTEGSVFFGIKK